MTKNALNRALRERLTYLGLACSVLVLDRLSKSLIHQTFSLEESRTAVEGFLEIVYFRNTGVAFGLFSGSGSEAKGLILSGFAVVAAVLVAVFSARTPARNRVEQTALALVFGGAIGNLWDRLVYSYVIDFLYFHLGSYYWPAFNLADASISVGVFLLALSIFRNESPDHA